jgi:hypothetical protein
MIFFTEIVKITHGLLELKLRIVIFAWIMQSRRLLKKSLKLVAYKNAHTNV